jgi:toxin ParE1/3/4
MPSRRKLSLAPAAEDDLADILQYTEKRWGSEQADSYQAMLQKVLLELVEFPHLGKARPDLPAGYRSLLADQHLIYYRIEGSAIRVSRILHVRREVRANMLE